MRATSSSIIFAFFLILHTALAIVYDPQIILPNSSTIWTAGRQELVTWNATGVPQGTPGMIMLGYLISGLSDEHLDYTLAKGFDLSQGQKTVVIPKGLRPRDSYILVLFGDSGNASPTFSIMAADNKKKRCRHKRGKKIEA